MKHSQSSALLCKDPIFRIWLDRRATHKHQVDVLDGTHTESDARDFICRACGIESRAELDSKPDAVATYLKIRSGFNRWKIKQPMKY